MNKKRQYLYGGLLLLLLLVGGGWWLSALLTERELLRVEALSEEEPEQALQRLEELSPRLWWSAEHRARRALLYSRTLDRNYIDLESDSLIRPAVEYYRLSGEPRYHMMAAYYLGRVHQNRGDLPRASVAFSRAAELADSLGDHHFGGLATHAISHICNEEYNLKEELRYSQRSYEHFLQTGNEPRIRYALRDLADAYYNNNALVEAARLYEALIERARSDSDTLYLAEGMVGLASVRLHQERVTEARSLFERVRRDFGYPPTVDWLTDYAFACALEGDAESAARWMEEAGSSASDLRERMRVAYRQYQIDTLQGRLREAFEGYKLIASVQDSIARSVLEQSALSARSDHFRSEMLETTLRLERQTIRIWGCGIALVFGLILVAGWLYERNRRRSRMIEEYMARIAAMNERLLGREAELTELGQRVSSLFKARFEPLNRLAETYYAHLNSPKEQERIFLRVKEDFARLGEAEYVGSELEPLINESFEGLMARFRAQLPHLREEEYRLACYLIVGFTYPSISLFLGRRVSTLYTRVSRLREQVLLSEAPDKEEFLSHLTKS